MNIPTGCCDTLKNAIDVDCIGCAEYHSRHMLYDLTNYFRMALEAKSDDIALMLLNNSEVSMLRSGANYDIPSCYHAFSLNEDTHRGGVIDAILSRIHPDKIMSYTDVTLLTLVTHFGWYNIAGRLMAAGADPYKRTVSAYFGDEQANALYFAVWFLCEQDPVIPAYVYAGVLNGTHICRFCDGCSETSVDKALIILYANYL